MITQSRRSVDTEAAWSTLYATRPLRPSASRSVIKSNTLSLGPKAPKTSQSAVIKRFTVIGSHTSKSYYRSYTVATSGINLSEYLSDYRLLCQSA
jgi:hypothetical protein